MLSDKQIRATAKLPPDWAAGELAREVLKLRKEQRATLAWLTMMLDDVYESRSGEYQPTTGWCESLRMHIDTALGHRSRAGRKTK